MSTQHTPGPWAFSTSTNGWCYTINIFQADNATPTDGWSDVGYIVKTCEGEQRAIQHANACLIAAAPELLEALRIAMKYAKPMLELEKRSPSNAQWMVEAVMQEETFINAAIAKATGGAV